MDFSPVRTAFRERIWPIGQALLFVALAAGCHTQKAATNPTIEFTKIPPAAQGGRERVDTISGRVTGAKPGQSIVIYAHSGPWWVQPWPDHPLIPIQADSTWSTETHLGFDYAAMLVDAGYHPPSTMDVAPAEGGAVELVKITKGTGQAQMAPVVPLRFSGYDWKVRTIAGDRGGLNNLYDGDNAWVDASGAMHLRIKKKENRWSCAEVVMSRSLGYGTYIVTVRDTTHLEPAVVLTLATFDDAGGDQHYREIDAEFGKWGDPSSKTNAQFGIQPFYVPGNQAPFNAPASTATYAVHWESGRATFKAVRGNSLKPGAPVIFEHEFTSGVPSAGQEVFEFLMYIVESKVPVAKEDEVVIEKFEFLP
jgi:hypothetical protein